MNEVTPDLIARIASRLYNETPGANQAPKSDADLYQHASSPPTGLPSGFPPSGHQSGGHSQSGHSSGYQPGGQPSGHSSGGYRPAGFSQAGGVPDHGPPNVGASGVSVPVGGQAGPPPGGAPSSPTFPGAGPFPGGGAAPHAEGYPASSGGAPTGGFPGGGFPGGSQPSGFTLPGFGANPTNFGSPAGLPGGFGSQSGLRSPGEFGGLPSSPGTSAVPGAASSAGSAAAPPSGGVPDGVKAFVDRIRGTSQVRETGPCLATGTGEPSLLQRLFAQAIVPGAPSPAPRLPNSGDQGRPQAFGGGALSLPQTGARPLDVPQIRRDFPILQEKVHGKPLVWFDNAATTQKPQAVIDALSHYYSHDNSNIHRGAHTLAARSTDAFEQARQKIQRFLGAASTREIVFVRGTTEGVNFVSNTWGRKFLQPGDEIVLTVLEHHANIVPWQMIAKERGAIIRVAPVDDHGEIRLADYGSLLGPRTKLVALAHASNSLGTLLPVAEMTHMAKRFGARVLIDGAQSVSHIPVDVQSLGCDFFVFSGHKIFGPTGIGAVYVKEEVAEIMPPWQGGGNMIKSVTFEETTYHEHPAKFEAGTPNIADVVGLGAALDYVSRLGLPNIGRYEHELLAYATERLARIDGVRLVGTAREKVSVQSFVLKDRKTEEVGKLLDQEGIAVRAGHHCAQPSLRRFGLEATVRPSFAFYNTFEEIDRLIDAVRRILRK